MLLLIIIIIIVISIIIITHDACVSWTQGDTQHYLETLPKAKYINNHVIKT